MSEPMIVYDESGDEWTLAAPEWVKEQVADGALFWSAPDVPEQPAGDSLTADDLNGMTVNELTDTLQDIDDVDLLQDALASESRVTAIAALEARIEVLGG